MRWLATALLCSCCGAFRPYLGSRSPQLAPARLLRWRSIELAQKNPVGFLAEAIDDVLTYLTNMGGYTGFTEADLKGDGSSSSVSKLDSQTDLDKWGKKKEVSSEATTTAFVLLLIIFPSALGFLFIQLYGAPAIFTFAAQ
mmetsp:Transcript_6061/g.19973  ORF Transcript_6061/g.19973 Transcript_6061/m.19973 type:complete len:141 (+) Transcript_6061:29-451(+)